MALLIRYLLIFLLIYVGLRLFRRILFGSPSQAGRSADNEGRRRPEGEVYIRYKPGKGSKKFRKEEGEYVKFEEVDDDN
ncbi:MAG: hypothetical protein JW801_08535 [Bacteroidales bacterium]|nr:hypothetical protein [Bacteroidales bacterium]